jgi:D-glycerate 3-kinase
VLSDQPLDHLIEYELARLRRGGLGTVILGICGAQGSGKSTLAASVIARLRDQGMACAVLSLDDLYLGSVDRERLAEANHPLLRTRGVPGTHDVDLGISVLGDVRAGRPTLLPRFDKASDEPADKAQWELVPANLDVLLFEGWCVGAVPEEPEALRNPLNALEADHDSDGHWRQFITRALSGSYQRLFAYLDGLVLLAAPRFEVVRSWRGQQEASLRQKTPNGAKLMSDAQIDTFVQHFERLTRHTLAEMPTRADLVIQLDQRREVVSITHRPRPEPAAGRDPGL